MEDEVKQGTFEGWAIVEMMGHRKEIGFVSVPSGYAGTARKRIHTRKPGVRPPQRLWRAMVPNWHKGKTRIKPSAFMSCRAVVALRNQSLYGTGGNGVD